MCCCYEWEDENFDRLNTKGCAPEHYAMKERAEMRQEMQCQFESLNARMNTQDEQFQNIHNSVQQLPEKMQMGLEEFVESNAVRNGTVTHAQFESFTNSITSAFKSVQAELIELRNQPSSELEMRMIPSEDALSVDADVEVFETAAGFVYPNVGLKEALTVWYYGGYYQELCLSEEELRTGERVRYPPLREVTCHDLERHNHSHKSKWSKVIKTVISFTPNIPEKPSARKLIEIMEARKHVVMAPSLINDIDQSSNSINTMYNYLCHKRKRDADFQEESEDSTHGGDSYRTIHTYNTRSRRK